MTTGDLWRVLRFARFPMEAHSLNLTMDRIELIPSPAATAPVRELCADLAKKLKAAGLARLDAWTDGEWIYVTEKETDD